MDDGVPRLTQIPNGHAVPPPMIVNGGGGGCGKYGDPQRANQSFRLSYVDFPPRCLNPGVQFTKPEFERFEVLVKKSNAWLRKHIEVYVCHCESVEVKANPEATEHVDMDNSTFWESGRFRTTFIRALRLWVRPRRVEDGPADEIQQISFINIIPACQLPGNVWNKPVFDSLGDTLQKFNDAIRDKPIPGRIINIETQEMMLTSWDGQIDPNRSSWTQSEDRRESFLYIIRVFYDRGPPSYEEIGCADFVPQVIEHSGGLMGVTYFERFNNLIERARVWLKKMNDIRVTNVQSIDYKLSGGWSGTIDTHRSFFIESSGYRTYFLRILRICYAKPYANSVYDSQGPYVENHIPRLLNYKTFHPIRLTFDGVRGTGKFETMSETMKRGIAWMQFAGELEPVSAETVPIRMYTGRQHGDSETTYSWNRAERGEYWMLVLRIYFDGHYEEPPSEVLPEIPPLQLSGECCAVL